MNLTLKVSVENPVEGQTIYWKVTADANNSKRNDPKIGLKENDKAALQELKDRVATCTSKVKGGEAAAVLVCGLAGGDVFTVEAGVEEGKYLASVKVVNWRKLEYIMWQPTASGADKISDFTVFKSDAGTGLADESTLYMEEILGATYVQFIQNGGGTYKKIDIPSNGVYNIFDAGYFGKAATKKMTVLSLDQATGLLNKKTPIATVNSRSVRTIFADYVVEPVAWRESLSEIFQECSVTPANYVFEKAIDTGHGINHGVFAIKKLAWRAVKWFDAGAPGGGAWKAIAAAGDPGFGHRNLTTFVTKEDISAHIEFFKWNEIRVKLPTTKNTYPGHKLTKDASGQLTDVGAVVAIEFIVEGQGVDADFNGCALQGDIWMTTFGGDIHNVGLAGVIMHELGHNMGQVYANKGTDATFGRPAGKEIPGVSIPPNISAGGDSYGGHQHQGTHCAKGVMNKAAASFQTAIAATEHKCLMFGSSDMQSATRYDFCEGCRKYIRAENLSDIRKSWT